MTLATSMVIGKSSCQLGMTPMPKARPESMLTIKLLARKLSGTPFLLNKTNRMRNIMIRDVPMNQLPVLLFMVWNTTSGPLELLSGVML